MSDLRTITSTSGDVRDVASFFRVSVRTVHNWKAQRPPLITHFQEGESICFGEEAVVRLRVKGSRASEAMEAGEAEAIARREWREHLKVRQEECLRHELHALTRRVDQLEKTFTEGNQGNEEREAAAA